MGLEAVGVTILQSKKCNKNIDAKTLLFVEKTSKKTIVFHKFLSLQL